MGAHTVIHDIHSHLGTVTTDSATAGRAEQASAATVQGSAEAVALLLTGMEALQSHTQALTLKMKRLGERSMEISAVTRTIQEITAEANMLALNATIEASRAGEHGIGFKAVASNIRKLAARTDAAAKDTTEMVAALHGEAADAVDCIERQTEQTEQQVSIITRTVEALTRCHDALAANGVRVAGISAAAEEQARAAERVSETLLGMTGFVRRAHVLSEQAIHSSAALQSMLSELHTWAQTFHVRTGSSVAAPPVLATEVIDLSPHDAVGNGRGA
jgi:methyl-accepting chemotaxis protein